MSNRIFLALIVALFSIATTAYFLGSSTNLPGTETVLPPPPQAPQSPILPYGEVTLRVGQTGVFQNVTLTLVRVFDDSRCPKGVTCIWSGTVKAEVSVVSGMGTSTSVIEIGNQLTTEVEAIDLVSVTPYPEEGKSIATNDYELTFAVRERTE